MLPPAAQALVLFSPRANQAEYKAKYRQESMGSLQHHL